MSYIRHRQQRRDIEIGFFQMQILLFLHNRDYYGYELLEELHMSGRTQLSSGSLYPTLRGLEKKGYLKSRHEESVATPDRRIYSITQKGREAIDSIFLFLTKMLSRIFWNNIKGLKKIVLENIDVREGETVVDFGEAFGELPIQELTPKNGCGFFFVNTVEEKNHVEKYFKRKGMPNITPLLLGKESPPASHVAFYDFFHHSPSPKEDIERMAGCLKSGGRIVILDSHFMPQISSVNEMFSLSFPRHENMLSEEQIKALLEEVGIINITTYSLGGLVFIKGEKP